MRGAAADGSRLANLYGRLCSAAVTIADGWLLPGGGVELQRSVRDVDEDRNRTFRYTFRRNDKDCPMPAEMPLFVSAVLPSPSGRCTARVVTLGEKPKARVCLELWQQGSLTARVDASKFHDSVLVGGTFGGFAWSRNELQIVYVAEAKAAESPSFFATPAAEEEAHIGESLGKLPPGQAHWYREDWGEQLPGSDRLALFVVDFADGCVRRLPGVAADVTPAHPCFWGEDVVYTAYPAGTRRLGMIYCHQRLSSLHLAPATLKSPANGESLAPHVCLTSSLRIARCARPKPGAQGPLVFLGSRDGFDTHVGCLELYRLDSPKASLQCIVPVSDTLGDDGFAGIYTDVALPRNCWGADDIFFNAFSGARAAAWRVPGDGSSPPVRVVAPEGVSRDASVTVIAANEADVLVTWSTPCRPSAAIVRPLAGGADVVLPSLGPCAVVAGISSGAAILEGLDWRVQEITPEDGTSPFNGLLVDPTEIQRPGLILFIHGGPHAVSTTEFQHATAFLVRATECAVLLVNYRGSAGFGRRALESLTGKVGSQDVQDCMAAVRTALASGRFDPSRVAVVGGSHGGFLTGHLIGQHPDIFAAASLRNPVTNIASMVTATDIPDWTFVEGIGIGSFDFTSPIPPTADMLSTMWSKSPCAHVSNVKTPTLLALGMKDQRVPPSQGIEFYHALKAKGVHVRMLCYEKETHQIASPAAEADYWINTCQWFNQHMPIATATLPSGSPPPGVAATELARGVSLGV